MENLKFIIGFVFHNSLPTDFQYKSKKKKINLNFLRPFLFFSEIFLTQNRFSMSSQVLRELCLGSPESPR